MTRSSTQHPATKKRGGDPDMKSQPARDTNKETAERNLDEQADCRVETCIVEWKIFHADPWVDRHIFDGRRGDGGKIHASNVEIVSPAQHDASGDARAAT